MSGWLKIYFPYLWKSVVHFPPTTWHKLHAGRGSASNTPALLRNDSDTVIAKCPEQILQGIVREAVGIEAD